MLVCRRRGDYRRSWKISAAFNVSQKDVTPLELFRETLRCGTIRRAGNGGWYWEVNRLSDIQQRVIPFFDRFPLLGTKARDYSAFRHAVVILARGLQSESDYAAVLELREQMNGGGKRRHSAAGILRDYTPTSPLSTER